jgi:hypothetical protein
MGRKITPMATPEAVTANLARKRQKELEDMQKDNDGTTRVMTTREIRSGVAPAISFSFPFR